ncbi:hypothetical protein [Paraburkholderia sp.]|uniref:hypothetical protein n=1 Tax=Paraburkholderia sp. TaxID=1926495 RepID=UPI003C7BBA5A
MNSMNYHGPMKKPNYSQVAGRSAPKASPIAPTSKGGRYSQATPTPVTPPRSVGVETRRVGWIRDRVTNHQLPPTNAIGNVRTRSFGVVKRSKDGEGSQSAELQKFFATRGGSAISESADPALMRLVRIRRLKEARIRKASSKANNVLVVDVRGKKATYWGGDPIVRTTGDVRELAVRTARMLGADPVRGTVEYLAAVFEAVSTGHVPRPETGDEPLTVQRTAAVTADPLAAARARGRRFALEEYESPDNLTLLDARAYAGRNERTINEQRQNGELYALLPTGKARGFRYPKWQFDAEPERLVAVLRQFAAAKTNSWVIHSFMRRKRDELGGKSPAEIILDERESVAPVVDLAARDCVGEQGAS